MHGTTESLLPKVSEQLRKLEERDWELWAIVSLTGVLASFTILAIALPRAFLTNGSFHFEVTISSSLAGFS